MQRAFPFRIPDSLLLEILAKIKNFHMEFPSVREWFYAAMRLLDNRCEVHFADLVTLRPSRNGCSTNLSIFSYQKGELTQYADFPNSFIAHAYKCCTGKKTPELTKIQLEAGVGDPDIPYCPVVVPLGCCDYHFGVFAAGSYHDRDIVERNSRLFEMLGMEMSLFLLIRHMDDMVSQLLFQNVSGNGECNPLGFEALLTYKFKQLMDKIDPEIGGNLLGEIITLVERVLIQLSLEKTGHKLGQSAALLGINRNTLRKKIKSLGIES